MISVIIPMYNVENFITQCLSSLEEQNYSLFEVVVIDDGSTDSSVEIVEDFMISSEMTIRLIKQQNSGVSQARNIGIKEAKGNYLCFLDSDDIVSPNYLSYMINELLKNSCELVICSTGSVDETFNYISGKLNKNNYPDTQIFSSLEGLRMYLYHKITSGACSIMVKKKLIQHNNLGFSEGYRYSEDLEFVWKLIAISNKITFTKNKLYFHRIRNGSAMSLVDSRRMDGMKLMIRLESYFQKHRPDFYPEFKRYGTARWLWATLWQIAVVSESYKVFIKEAQKFNARKYMKKLITSPEKRVSLSSILFYLSPYFYFLLAKKRGVKRLQTRQVTSSREHE